MSPPPRVVGAARACVLLCVVLCASAAAAAEAPRGYRNPVSRSFADTFADASIIRGKDGFWYAYASSTRLRPQQERTHLIPIVRTSDLIHWRHVGDAFEGADHLPWAGTGVPRAPEVHYVRGRYLLYYAFGGAIGVATAPSPTGPWTDTGRPLVDPLAGAGSVSDPALFTHRSGKRYLYFASERGAIFVSRLARDGLQLRGEPRRLTVDAGYAAPAIVRRGRYLYILVSAGVGNGAADGRSIVAARAVSPLGPFEDRWGRDLAHRGSAGAVVTAPNGNRWMGTTGASIVTDLGGRSWVGYGATSRGRPHFDASEGSFTRPLLLDRLTWRDGWPLVRAGRFASQGRQPSPDTGWEIGGLFDAGSLTGGDWQTSGGRWAFVDRGDTGIMRGTARSCREAYLTTTETISGPIRAEADVRAGDDEAAVGLVAAYRARDRRVVAWLDAAFQELLLSIEGGGALFVTRAPLPDDFEARQLHNLSLELDGGGIRAEVTEARMGDPLAAVHAPSLPGGPGAGSVGIAVACGKGEAAGAGASTFTSSSIRPPLPPSHRLAPGWGDEFEGGSLATGWHWVRAPTGSVEEGVLNWPAQDASLTGARNTASVLLRRAPPGRYTVETKLRWHTEVGSLAGAPSAGLVAYLGDDHFLQVAHRARASTSPGRFVKEMPGQAGPRRGDMPLALGGGTVWLRMSHRVDAHNGEHEFTSATSDDGEHWARAGTWTLPPGRAPRVGLVAMDGTGAQARFAYFRVLLP